MQYATVEPLATGHYLRWQPLIPVALILQCSHLSIVTKNTAPMGDYYRQVPLHKSLQ